MLPARHRLRDAGQYRAVLRDRRSGRAGGSLVVVHVADTDAFDPPPDDRDGPRVGFVVSKAVGNAVVRSRVKRVLRHRMAEEIAHLPRSADVVVRANPAIATASTEQVRSELRRVLDKACRRAVENASRGAA